MAQIRHLTADMLRRLGACIGAVLVLALIVGLGGAHQHAAAGEAPVAAAAETSVASNMGHECPHEAHHQQHDTECCLGLGCAAAMVPPSASVPGPNSEVAVWPLAAPTSPTGDSGGQFRPPRLLPTA